MSWDLSRDEGESVRVELVHFGGGNIRLRVTGNESSRADSRVAMKGKLLAGNEDQTTSGVMKVGLKSDCWRLGDTDLEALQSWSGYIEAKHV